MPRTKKSEKERKRHLAHAGLASHLDKEFVHVSLRDVKKRSVVQRIPVVSGVQ